MDKETHKEFARLWYFIGKLWRKNYDNAEIERLIESETNLAGYKKHIRKRRVLRSVRKKKLGSNGCNKKNTCKSCNNPNTVNGLEIFDMEVR